jgi:hypothetical protein
MLSGITVITGQVVTAAEFDNAFCTAAIENDGKGNTLTHSILEIHDATASSIVGFVLL